MSNRLELGASIVCSLLLLTGCSEQNKNQAPTPSAIRATLNPEQSRPIPPKSYTPVPFVPGSGNYPDFGYKLSLSDTLAKKISDGLKYASSDPLNYLTNVNDITAGHCVLLYKRGDFGAADRRSVNLETLSTKINRLAGAASGFACNFPDITPPSTLTIFGLTDTEKLYLTQSSSGGISLNVTRRGLKRDVIGQMTLYFRVDSKGKVIAPDGTRLSMVVEDALAYIGPGVILDQ